MHLLSQADPESKDDSQVVESEEALAAARAQASSPIRSEEDDSAESTLQDVDHTFSVSVEDIHGQIVQADYQEAAGHDEDKLHASQGRRDGERVFYSFPNTPTRSAVTLPNVSSSSSIESQYLADVDAGNVNEALLPGSFALGRRRR